VRQPCSPIEGPYLHDLLAQPEAVAGTCRALHHIDLGSIPERFHEGAFDRVVLTGMGSSHHALHVTTPELSATRRPVILIETSELVQVHSGLLTKQTLLVAVSQSGESAEIRRLVEQIPAGCCLVGVTNSPTSALARAAAVTLGTAAGAETTVACKTYLAAVTALLWFTATLQGVDPRTAAADLAPAAAVIANYLSAWRDHVRLLVDLLPAVRHLYLTGRGASLAAAGQGALTLKEAARFPAEAISTAAFRHGPLEVLGPESAVLVLEGPVNLAPLNLQFLEDLRGLGTNVLQLGRSSIQPPLRIPPVSDRLLPFVEVLPLQLTSLALAALAGREAGCFRFASKITRAD
jgi:glutamine---fructose-6-phosphate transaminase (isomerizing)